MIRDLIVDARPKVPCRWTLVEPAFVSPRGHQMAYALGMGSALRERGATLSVVSDPALDDDTRHELAAAGISQLAGPAIDIWRDTGGSHAARFEAGFRWGQLASRVCADRASSGPVFSVTGNARLLFGLCAGLSSASMRQPYRVMFYDWNRFTSGSPIGRLRDPAFRALVGHCVRTDRLRIFGQSAEIAEEIAESVGLPVAELPMLIDWSEAPAALGPGARELPRIGFVGEARPEKGWAQFCEVAEALRGEVAAYALVSCPAGTDSKIFEHAVLRLRALPNCQVTTGRATPREYFEFIASLDFAFLAYDPLVYARRTSSILMESLGMGTVPVVCAQTWLSRTVERERAEAVIATDWRGSSIALALHNRLPDWQRARDRAVGGAARWRELHNAPQFCELLEQG